MTETEWLTCENLQEMRTFLRSHELLNDRKNRLFNVACCRRAWHLYRPVVRSAIEVGEAFADGRASPEELREALRTIHRERAGVGWSAELHALQAAGFVAVSPEFARPALPLHAASELRLALAHPNRPDDNSTRRIREERALCDLVREVIGNPFREVVLDPAWRTPTVLNVAEGIYEERAFEAMPILADALEEAGCDRAEVLGHCRGGIEHTRGCWLLDAILGKGWEAL